MESTKLETTTDYFWQELKLLDGPGRWFYWAFGLFSILQYQNGVLNSGAMIGLALYLGLNIALIPLLTRSGLRRGRYLIVGSYITDLLFASMLIYHTGGFTSQLFLLYCLLPLKAAVYYPYIHRIIFIPLSIFALYIGTLYLSQGNLAFLFKDTFISRYVLLLLVVFAAMFTAWHLDTRHRQTRDLLKQLKVEHRRVDRRRRELNAVLDSIADGVIVVDSELRLLMTNPVAAGFLNLSYPQPPGTPLGDLIDNLSLLTLLRQALTAVDQAGPLLDDEIKVWPTGRNKPVICQALATALVSKQDAPHGAVVVLRDMTRQRELDESKSNFISMLSHELRTPLTAIRGFVELILTDDRDQISPSHKESLNTVFSQTESLQSLINALLEFAELEAAEINLQLDLVRIKDMVHRVVDQTKALVEPRAIDLQVQVAPNLKPLFADGSRLERVLFNLIDNAVKFTPDRGQVKITADDLKDEVLVCVIDSGPGVPQTEREHIFERFYQIDDSSTREHGGTGLGLAVCKYIIEMHHGHIWVEDPQEKIAANGGPGSRFCFTIPRNLAQQSELEYAKLEMHP